MEGADEVLALGQVHTGLAAHARVDHGEQRRRQLHEGDPAQVRGSGEPGEVADHAAAERHDEARSVDAGAAQRRADLRERRERLRALAGRHGDTRDARPGELEGRAHRGAVQALDGGVADQRDVPRDGDAVLGEHAPEAPGEVAPDDHGVGGIDAHGHHDGFGSGAHAFASRPASGAVWRSAHASSFSTISSTTSCESRPSVETVTLATSS